MAAKKKPQLNIDPAALEEGAQQLRPRKLNTTTGKISEWIDGEWVDTGLTQETEVPEDAWSQYRANTVKVLSAPARLALRIAGQDTGDAPDLYERQFSQNPYAAFAGNVVGNIPSMGAGAVLGAGMGLAANAGIQGTLGAMSNAEDPLSGALWQVATVGAAGLLPKAYKAVVGGGRARAGAGLAEDATLAGSPGELPGQTPMPPPGPRGAGWQQQLTQQQQATTYGGAAPPGAPVPGRSGLLGAIDDALRPGVPMDPAQLARAKALGLYVDPGSELGSNTLRRFQQRTVMDAAMDVGREQNQALLSQAARDAAGIEAKTVNSVTLQQAMERTANGFRASAGEMKPISKARFESTLGTLLEDGEAGGLIKRLRRAPDTLDGDQVHNLQQYIAKERAKWYTNNDRNLGDVWNAANNRVLDLIEKRVPEGSRGNYQALRQQYQAQQALSRPGVMGAGDTINPTSFYSGLGREAPQRMSPELRRARDIAQLMHTMRDTLGNSGTAGRLSNAWGAGVGATAGSMLGGPIGGAIGGVLGAGAQRLSPAGLFAAYNKGAPLVQGLLERGAP